MNPVQYIFLRQDLGMSTGKAAAQVAHAAVLSAFGSHPSIRDNWLVSGHYTKLVMLARDAEHLYAIERYLRDREFDTFLVIDEGRTEIDSHTPTALAAEIVDKDLGRVRQVFGDFKLYPKDPVKKGLFSKT